MHLLTTTSTSLDEIADAVDLGQPAGDIAVLSFADSDLAALSAAWEVEREFLPSVRLAHLRELRHPLSVDLWIERVGAHARVIVVRLLGGLEWWKYGIERLSALARERAIVLAVLPGEDRDDTRLAAASTLPDHELGTLLQYFREGGSENLRRLLRRLARYAGRDLAVEPSQPVPQCAGYWPGQGALDLQRLIEVLSLSPAERGGARGGNRAPPLSGGAKIVPIIFYRAMLLAADTAPVDALCAALSARGLAPAPLV
ncbi:MAG: cobaltochelatase subunit CobN, partial [Xanthobacteraceae bacterium]